MIRYYQNGTKYLQPEYPWAGDLNTFEQVSFALRMHYCIALYAQRQPQDNCFKLILNHTLNFYIPIFYLPHRAMQQSNSGSDLSTMI